MDVNVTTLLYTDPLFMEHRTGRGHPERPERLQAITERLANTDLPSRCATADWQPIDVEAVAQIHSVQQRATIQQLIADGGGFVDGDTVVSPKSLDVALSAAGVAVSAVDQVIAREHCNALCLVRPPGHHATPTRSMGFCLFNNAALAAHHAKTKHYLNRILIIDWDVHHGNGTQDVFYRDPAVTFLSVHRYGMGFYPGTGGAHESGEGAGLGHTLNVPVRYGTSRDDYHDLFLRGLEKTAELSKPELVLISAGFDAHALDPIGSLGLETEDFAVLTRRVLEVARTHCQGRVVSLLEGGYHLDALAESVEVHLKELLSTGEAVQ